MEKRKSLSKKEIREFCRQHASEFVDIQREEFKDLGIIADWDKPYLTMKFEFEAAIYRTLCEIAKKAYFVSVLNLFLELGGKVSFSGS